MRRTAALPLALVLAMSATGHGAGVVVPFRWTPGQIEVAVRVNDTPAVFILDTGAEYSVVSTRLASALGLGLETRGSRAFADGVTIEVGELALQDQRVMVMPFEAYNQRGRDVQGLVGYDFFAAWVVSIDFKAATLRIAKPSSFEPPRAAVSVPLAFAGRLPVIPAVLRLAGGRSLDARLMVDTGASQSVILRHPFATTHRLFDLGGAASTTPSLASGERRMQSVPVEQVTVGGWTFDRPAVLAFAEPVGSAASTATDGLVGNGLLARFILHVDYPGKRLLFEPGRR